MDAGPSCLHAGRVRLPHETWGICGCRGNWSLRGLVHVGAQGVARDACNGFDLLRYLNAGAPNARNNLANKLRGYPDGTRKLAFRQSVFLEVCGENFHAECVAYRYTPRKRFLLHV